MFKNIKDLSDLIKIDNNKDIVFDVLKIIKNETGLGLKKESVLVRKNILKIKSNSNTRFVILLHLEKINKKIKDLNSSFTLEL